MEVAYHAAAIYFPFDDVIVSDPYKDLADDLRMAFYIGQSKVVGGTTTDMVAYDTGGVFIEIWIGVDDKLPRLLRAIYSDDPNEIPAPTGTLQLAARSECDRGFFHYGEGENGDAHQICASRRAASATRGSEGTPATNSTPTPTAKPNGSQ